MTKRGLAASTAVLALVVPRLAAAQAAYVQPDAPQWLQDRRYSEGIGIREGDIELHPGIAGEVGYDSNWFLRSSGFGYANVNNPTVPAPPIPALIFRLDAVLLLQVDARPAAPRRRRRAPEPPSVAFRAGVNATYREFIGVSGSSAAFRAAERHFEPAQRLRHGGREARHLAPAPARCLALRVPYAHSIQPQQHHRQSRPVVQPGRRGRRRRARGAAWESGTLDWRLGYQFRDTIFEQTDGTPYDNTTHEVYTRGRWRFRPRTALVYDGSLRFVSYQNPAQANEQGLFNSQPVRARIGLNGLVTDRFTVLLLAGWGASFADNVLPNQPQYDSVIGQAELKWFLSASPGLALSGDVGAALSSIAVGYSRDFQQSFLGDYYGLDRGYVRFSYFFAQRALLSIEGGAGAVEYPTLVWGPGFPNTQAGTVRH